MGIYGVLMSLWFDLGVRASPARELRGGGGGGAPSGGASNDVGDDGGGNMFDPIVIHLTGLTIASIFLCAEGFVRNGDSNMIRSRKATALVILACILALIGFVGTVTHFIDATETFSNYLACIFVGAYVLSFCFLACADNIHKCMAKRCLTAGHSLRLTNAAEMYNMGYKSYSTSFVCDLCNSKYPSLLHDVPTHLRGPSRTFYRCDMCEVDFCEECMPEEDMCKQHSRTRGSTSSEDSNCEEDGSSSDEEDSSCC